MPNLVWNRKNEVFDFIKNLPEVDFSLCAELSKNPETTSNIYIESDNLLALKYLQKGYYNRIKAVYIDPPYNTGFNFVYKDQKNDDEWCSFILARLLLAYPLLKDDGCMFISIDDNEYHNLIHICREVFGDDNVETLIWQKVGEGDAGAGKMKQCQRFRVEHEYIICCYRNKKLVSFTKTKEVPNFKNKYKNLDNDPRGAFKGGNISKTEEKSIPDGKNYYTVTAPNGRKFTRQWHFDEDTFNKLNLDNRIYWGKNKNSVPAIKIFLSEEREIIPSSILINKGSATLANKQLKSIFGEVLFENSKPVKLIKYLLQRITSYDDIILDFFSGSASTAHAVMELNAEDGFNRKFIMIQSPDLCPHKSKATKLGFKTISQIGVERINLAEKAIKKEYPNSKVDFGYSFFKSLNQSNK